MRSAISSPGGWVRVMGNSIAWKDGVCVSALRKKNTFPSEVKALLIPDTLAVAAGAESYELTLVEADCYHAKFKIPGSAKAGSVNQPALKYSLYYINGLLGTAGEIWAGVVLLTAHSHWPTDVFTVFDGSDGLENAIAQAKMNGGGIIEFPAGSFNMGSKQIFLPEKTILRGAGMENTILEWPRSDNILKSLVMGVSSFGVEDVTIKGNGNLKSGIETYKKAIGVRIARTRIIMGASEKYYMKSGINMKGNFFSITDCEIKSIGNCDSSFPSATIFQVRNATRGIISNNKGDYTCWGYILGDNRGIIFEDNTITSVGSHRAGGSTVSSYGTARQDNMYFARNKLTDNRSLPILKSGITLDGGGGAVFSKVKSAELIDGLTLNGDSVKYVKVTLIELPSFDPPSKTDWKNAVFSVLEGGGKGQMRRVESHDGKVWILDRPFTEALNEDSIVTVTPMRGYLAFVGNILRDIDAIQMYGSSTHIIIADNDLEYTEGGINAWAKFSGRNGNEVWQPSWFILTYRNQLNDADGIKTISNNIHEDDSEFAGSLARYHIHRNNFLVNECALSVGGTASNILVEGNHIEEKSNGRTLEVADTCTFVYLRKNTISPFVDN